MNIFYLCVWSVCFCVSVRVSHRQRASVLQCCILRLTGARGENCQEADRSSHTHFHVALLYFPFSIKRRLPGKFAY